MSQQSACVYNLHHYRPSKIFRLQNSLHKENEENNEQKIETHSLEEQHRSCVTDINTVKDVDLG